jgi:hypothetical protein
VCTHYRIRLAGQAFSQRRHIPGCATIPQGDCRISRESLPAGACDGGAAEPTLESVVIHAQQGH